jgi:hypothetical protein
MLTRLQEMMPPPTENTLKVKSKPLTNTLFGSPTEDKKLLEKEENSLIKDVIHH